MFDSLLRAFSFSFSLSNRPTNHKRLWRTGSSTTHLLSSSPHRGAATSFSPSACFHVRLCLSFFFPQHFSRCAFASARSLPLSEAVVRSPPAWTLPCAHLPRGVKRAAFRAASGAFFSVRLLSVVRSGAFLPFSQVSRPPVLFAAPLDELALV